MEPKPFPEDFLWGASVAGHQVEGGNYDQWTVWEAEQAKRLAQSARQRLGPLPNWPDIKDQAEDQSNYLSGRGVDHYRLYRQDFAIVQKMNLNAFRFSIEWSRLEPEDGVWDQAAVDHYHNYLAELKKRGITPVINLWHWTHPVWFEEKGGFSQSGNIGYFLRFVGKFLEEYKDEAEYVVTLNEPNNYVLFGFLTGRWPPAKRNPLRAGTVFWNLQKAHRYAHTLIKHEAAHIQTGLAYAVSYNVPQRSNSGLDKVNARIFDYVANWWFLNRVRKHSDFIGINYYHTNHIRGLRLTNPAEPMNDLGWHMNPSGLSEVIMRAWLRYHKPVIVTENGVADAKDQHRQWWLKESMLALHNARRAGADVRGYLHWSLLDNFEWDEGWWPKFGLIAVDREAGMKRSARPSAVWWAQQLGRIRGLNK